MILKHPRRRHRRHQNPYVSDVDPLAGAPAYDTTSGPNIVSMAQQLGPVVTGTPIQLVFWGQAYNSNTDPCPALVQAAFTVTSSAYTSKLAQYSSQEGNASIGALVQPSIFLSVDPPATYFDTDLISQAISQYASGNFGNITPIRDGTEGFPGILIVFVMPPNCSYGGPFAGGPGPQGAIGEHLEASVNGVIVPFAWIAFDVSTDLMTVDLSHEIVEMATDPFGLTDPAVATTNGGGPYASNPGALTEIADDGWEWFAAISGSLFATYWSNSDGACLVFATGPVVAAVEHAGLVLLRGGSRRGFCAVRQAGDLQHRPRGAVHRRRLHEAASRARHCVDQHGRQGTLPRQRLHRTALALAEVRGGLTCTRTTEGARGASRCIGRYLAFYNDERPHQSLGYQTPDAFYRGWRRQGSALDALRPPQHTVSLELVSLPASRSPLPRFASTAGATSTAARSS